MKTKILACILVAAFVILSLAACSSGATATNLTGAPVDILNKIVEDATAALPDSSPMPMSFTNDINADTSQNVMGITSADFTANIEAAASSTAAIATFAHEIVMIQCKDSADVSNVMSLLTGNYNPHKWICVFPEQVAVISSGVYVMLVASRADVVDAVSTAFKNEAGTASDLNIFYQLINDTGATLNGGGGGMGIGIDATVASGS